MYCFTKTSKGKQLSPKKPEVIGCRIGANRRESFVTFHIHTGPSGHLIHRTYGKLMHYVTRHCDQETWHPEYACTAPAPPDHIIWTSYDHPLKVVSQWPISVPFGPTQYLPKWPCPGLTVQQIWISFDHPLESYQAWSHRPSVFIVAQQVHAY